MTKHVRNEDAYALQSTLRKHFSSPDPLLGVLLNPCAFCFSMIETADLNMVEYVLHAVISRIMCL